MYFSCLPGSKRQTDSIWIFILNNNPNLASKHENHKISKCIAEFHPEEQAAHVVIQ